MNQFIERYFTLLKKRPISNICDTYTQLSARYSHIEKSCFPIFATHKEEKEDSSNEREIKWIESEIFNLVEKKDRIILAGDPGSGKTTALKWLIFQYIDKYQNDLHNQCIPIYIDLSDFREGDFCHYVQKVMAEFRIQNHELSDLLTHYSLIFLIDGLDIASGKKGFDPNAKIRDFILDCFSINPNNTHKFVITSRYGYYQYFKKPDLKFTIAEIEELTDPAIYSYTENYLSDPADQNLATSLKEQIEKSDELRDLCRNPLMLFIFIFVANDPSNRKIIESFPLKRVYLYKEFINLIVDYRNINRSPQLSDDFRSDIESFLAEFYFTLQCSNEVSCSYDKAKKWAKEWAKNSSVIISETGRDSSEILNECKSLGLISIQNYQISFGFHQSFLEYYAAIFLANLYDSSNIISPVFSHPRWENVILFAVEMVKDPDSFVSDIIRNGNIHLAAKCAPQVSDSIKLIIHEKLASHLNSRYESEVNHTLKSLGHLGDMSIDSIVPLCMKYPNVRLTAMYALYEIRSERAAVSLISLCHNADSHVRRVVIKILGEIKSERSVDTLISMLHDTDSEVRWTAVKILGEIKSERSVDTLISMLHDTDSDVRWATVDALCNIKSERVVDSLIPMLHDTDSVARWTALKILGKIKSELAIDSLILMLHDTDSDVRWATVDAFCNIKSERAVDSLILMLHDTDSEVRWATVDALCNIKSEHAVDSLIIILHDTDSDVRCAVVKILGEIKSERSVDSLVLMLHDTDYYVRRATVDALCNINSEHAVDSLVLMLHDTDSDVRRATVDALCKIKSERAVDSLISMLHDTDCYVRRAALKILGEIKSERSVDSLIPMLHDTDYYVRRAAVKILGGIKSEHAVDSLIPILHDSDSEVRCATVDALGEIKSEPAVDSLVLMLHDTDYYVRRATVDALCNIKSERSVDSLILMLHDTDSEVRYAALKILGEIKSERSVDSLVLMLHDTDSDVRRATVDALCKIKSERSVDSLVLMLHDTDSDVRRATVDALCKIKSERAVDSLISMLHDTDYYIRRAALKILGEIKSERSVDSLILMLHDTDSEVRYAVVKILGEIKSERSVDSLISMLHDIDSRVRWATVDSLCKIKLERAVDSLILMLHDTISEVRCPTVDAVCNIKSESSVYSLISVLYDTDSEICHIIKHFLECNLSIIQENTCVELLNSKDDSIANIAYDILQDIQQKKASEKVFKPSDFESLRETVEISNKSHFWSALNQIFLGQTQLDFTDAAITADSKTLDYLRVNLFADILTCKKQNKGIIKWLDVGCGNGRCTTVLEKVDDNDLENVKILYYGADRDRTYFTTSKERLSKYPFVVPKFISTDLSSPIPKSIGEFDIISVIYLAHELSPINIIQIFKNLLDSLKEDGVLIIVDFEQPYEPENDVVIWNSKFVKKILKYLNATCIFEEIGISTFPKEYPIFKGFAQKNNSYSSDFIADHTFLEKLLKDKKRKTHGELNTITRKIKNRCNEILGEIYPGYKNLNETEKREIFENLKEHEISKLYNEFGDNGTIWQFKYSFYHKQIVYLDRNLDELEENIHRGKHKGRFWWKGRKNYLRPVTGL